MERREEFRRTLFSRSRLHGVPRGMVDSGERVMGGGWRRGKGRLRLFARLFGT